MAKRSRKTPSQEMATALQLLDDIIQFDTPTSSAAASSAALTAALFAVPPAAKKRAVGGTDAEQQKKKRAANADKKKQQTGRGKKAADDGKQKAKNMPDSAEAGKEKQQQQHEAEIQVLAVKKNVLAAQGDMEIAGAEGYMMEEDQEEWLEEIPQELRAQMLQRHLGCSLEPPMEGIPKLSPATNLSSIGYLLGGVEGWKPGNRMTRIRGRVMGDAEIHDTLIADVRRVETKLTFGRGGHILFIYGWLNSGAEKMAVLKNGMVVDMFFLNIKDQPKEKHCGTLPYQAFFNKCSSLTILEEPAWELQSVGTGTMPKGKLAIEHTVDTPVEQQPLGTGTMTKGKLAIEHAVNNPEEEQPVEELSSGEDEQDEDADDDEEDANEV